MSLSVSTPKHLREIGLLEDDASAGQDYEATINYLYLQGLQKIVFLPYAYLTDLWRWDVFKGKITSENYNCQWWRLRYERKPHLPLEIDGQRNINRPPPFMCPPIPRCWSQ
jgi:hypothetical protein